MGGNLSLWRHLASMKPKIHLKFQLNLEDQRLLILILLGSNWNGKDQNGMEEVPLLDTSLRRETPIIKDGKSVPRLTQRSQLVKLKVLLRVSFMSLELRQSTKQENLNHQIHLCHTEPGQRTLHLELIETP